MPSIVDRPDLSLIDLTERAQTLANRLNPTLDPLTKLEMLSGLQMVCRMDNDGAKRIGLVCWLATWLEIK